MRKETWLDGIVGVLTGDALGNPVQFMDRDALKRRGLVKGMESGGFFQTPAGTWTDDGSMTLATLDAIRTTGRLDPDDVMKNFVAWNRNGRYVQGGRAFDQGATCLSAIRRYDELGFDVESCGLDDEWSNGNGALMRIMPACLYAMETTDDVDEAERIVDSITALTHAHERAKIASKLYFHMARSVVENDGTLFERMKEGLDAGFIRFSASKEIRWFARMQNLKAFASLPEEEISSSGYCVDSLEAATWSLASTSSFEECLLKAVNLAEDADSVGAIAGGIAGLYYGRTSIPREWTDVMRKLETVEEWCRTMPFSK